MLYVFGFERVGVVLSDLYFVDPDPDPGQEGPERGVRLEVRLLERPPVPGSVYSAQPILVDRPVWRADLLESVASPAASFDRTRHHPRFRDWEPGSRTFEPALSAAPIEWVGERLADVATLAKEAGLEPDTVPPGDAEAIASAVPEILDALRRLLARVHAGELGVAPTADPAAVARAGWL